MAQPTPDALDLFAVCLPGLEPWLAAELMHIGVREANPEAGGVAWRGDFESAYRTNLLSGLASQVLVRVADFGARSLQDLDVRGARIEWRHWLPPGAACTVKARCRRSRIYHSDAAAGRIERHLQSQLGPPADPSAAPIPVRVRIHDNRCTISLDTSGEPLHRRGWRLNSGKAPLREDLAHALVLASGWDGQQPLLDPMMGAGTILVEAACLARGLAPGRLRSFAIERFAVHNAGLLASLRETLTTRARPALRTTLFGRDRDPAALAATRANAGRAGVLDDLDLGTVGLGSCVETLGELPPNGVLVTNPPYGRRVGSPESLPNLYRTLGRVARGLPEDWQVALAAADRRLALRSGLPLQTAFLADSGGLKIRALTTADTTPRSFDP